MSQHDPWAIEVEHAATYLTVYRRDRSGPSSVGGPEILRATLAEMEKQRGVCVPAAFAGAINPSATPSAPTMLRSLICEYSHCLSSQLTLRQNIVLTLDNLSMTTSRHRAAVNVHVWHYGGIEAPELINSWVWVSSWVHIHTLTCPGTQSLF